MNDQTTTPIIEIVDSEFGAFATMAREANAADLTIQRIEIHHHDASVGDSGFSKAYVRASVGGLEDLLKGVQKQSFYDRMARNEVDVMFKIPPVNNGPRLQERKDKAEVALRETLKVIDGEPMQKIVERATALVQKLIEEFNTRALDNVLHTIKRGAAAFDDDEFPQERAEIKALNQQHAEISAKLKAAKDGLFIKTRAEVIKYINKEGLDKFVDVEALRNIERPSSPFHD